MKSLKKKIACPCLKWNNDGTAVQPVPWSLHLLIYRGFSEVRYNSLNFSNIRDWRLALQWDLFKPREEYIYLEVARLRFKACIDVVDKKNIKPLPQSQPVVQSSHVTHPGPHNKFNNSSGH
jgi:hypothetical protein